MEVATRAAVPLARYSIGLNTHRFCDTGTLLSIHAQKRRENGALLCRVEIVKNTGTDRTVLRMGNPWSSFYFTLNVTVLWNNLPEVFQALTTSLWLPTASAAEPVMVPLLEAAT